MPIPAKRPPALLIVGAVVFVVAALIIARVFDSPTSVILLFGMSALALTVSFFAVRRAN